MPAFAGMPRLEKTAEAVVTSTPLGANVVEEQRTVSIQNTTPSDALEVAATISATPGDLLLEIIDPVAEVGTVPGMSIVTSIDTYTLRREIQPGCPLCSPWTPDECQACSLDGGSLATLISELPPDAPQISLTGVTNTSISGTIGACTRAGIPLPACHQRVLLVPDGQSCTANPVAAKLGLTSAAQSWTIPGLTPSTTYIACAAAGHSQAQPSVISQSPDKASTSPNRPPNAPILQGHATLSTKIVGSVVCNDDGLPIGSQCNTTIRAVRQPGGGSGSCSVPIGPPNVFHTIVSGSNPWEIDIPLSSNTDYRLFAQSTDGEFQSTCTGPVLVTTPGTVAGCEKRHARTEIQCGPTYTCTTIRGVAATWTIRNMSAMDWQQGGFVLNAVWLGVNNKKVEDESIEVGVSDGYNGLGGYRFYTAWWKKTGSVFASFDLGGAPADGQTVRASVVSCAHNPQGEGCRQPWTAESEREHVVRIGGVNGRWDPNTVPGHIQGGSYIAPSYGARNATAGLETTCNSVSRVNATKIRDMEYRLGLSSWTNLHNHYPAVAVSKTPPATTEQGIDCCNGFVSGTNRCSHQPSGKADFFVWLNSATPTTPQAACQ